MATSNVSVPSSPVAVFTPSGNTTVAVLTNTGTSTLFLGQSGVTAATGLPLLAGQSIQVDYNSAIYAVCGVDEIVTPTNTLSADATGGATALTVAANGTDFTNGMVISIIDGNSTEIVTVGAGATATNVPVSATANAHLTGVTFGQFSKHTGGSIQVSTGV